MTLLSVIVPVLNEADNIPPLLLEITEALAGKYEFEVIFVDDASTDDTSLILARLLDEVPQLRVVRHVTRAQQSYAVRTGIKLAKGTWIATLDGDGQNDPADLPKLLEKALAGGEALGLVGGVRLKRRDTVAKRIGSKVGNGVRQFFLRDNCPDTGCGIKVFRRAPYLELPMFNGQHRYLPALFQTLGFTTEFLPVNHRPRERGVSKYNNLQRGIVGIRDLIGVSWLRSRMIKVNAKEITK